MACFTPGYNKVTFWCAFLNNTLLILQMTLAYIGLE